ncbi:MAG TPA: alpha/beta hydrolase [Chloroflexi bacterium]|jgi:N-formylmaleamate deformylase|nr:alpha/beta hydrolase [Chloroflexota bacterium]
MAEWCSGDVIANGIRIHYYRTGDPSTWGKKPAVVLCHGFTDSGLCWTRVARVLEADYDVVMPDARGHGLSELPSEGLVREAMADDVAGVIEALELDHPVAIGHSMGGGMVGMMAARHPDLLRGVALEDAGFGAPPNRFRNMTEEERAQRLRQATGWVEQLRGKTREELIEICRQQSPTWHEDELGPWADSKLQFRASGGLQFGDGGKPWQDLVRAIRCPILIIRADPAKGGGVTEEVAAEIQSVGRDVRVVHLPEAGHNVRREAYDGFMAAITEFLSYCYSA